MHRCPASYVTGEAQKLVAYFYDYKDGRGFPDGRARMYQPVKLIRAFNVLAVLYNELYQKYELKKDRP